MHAIGYVVYDPEAPPGSSASQSGRTSEVVRFCQAGGHTLATVFTDPIGDGIVSHQAFQQMVKYLQEQPEQFLVVVTDSSLLGSSLEEAVDAVLKVDDLGSRVVTTVEGSPDPLQGLYRMITSAGPGGERRMRIREAMESKALRGEGLGRPAYGYRIGSDGKLEEVSEEAEVVRLMFRLYVEEGLGVRSIARYLNDGEYRTRRGRNWSVVTLWGILRNRVYIGTYNRFGLRMPGNHPPLVLPETFRRVQDLMQSRSPWRRGADAQPYILSGLAYCVQCGNRMGGVTRRQTWRRKDGSRMRGVYRYYQCQSRTNQSWCQYHTWRAADLEEAVREQLGQRIQKYTLGPSAGQQDVLQRSLKATHEDMKSRGLRGRYSKYLKQAADGAISLRRLRSLLDQLLDVALEPNKGANLDNQSDVKVLLDIAEWHGLVHNVKSQLLHRWVERIEVGDGEVEVRLL